MRTRRSVKTLALLAALLALPTSAFAAPPAPPAPGGTGTAPPAPKKGGKGKPKKGQPPAPTPAPVAPVEPPPPPPPAAQVQNREDPNAKSPEELAKEKEAAEAAKEKSTAIGGLLGVNIPVGPYAGVSGVGFGGYLDFEHKVIPALAIGARVGFQYHLDGHSTRLENGVNHDIAGRAHVLPIALSARVYPMKEGSAGAPYFLFEPGIFLRMVSEDDTNPTTKATVSNDAFKANFGVGLGAGYTIKGLDARLMFTTYDVTKADVRLALGILVGYRFATF